MIHEKYVDEISLFTVVHIAFLVDHLLHHIATEKSTSSRNPISGAFLILWMSLISWYNTSSLKPSRTQVSYSTIWYNIVLHRQYVTSIPFPWSIRHLSAEPLQEDVIQACTAAVGGRIHVVCVGISEGIPEFEAKPWWPITELSWWPLVRLNMGQVYIYIYIVYIYIYIIYISQDSERKKEALSCGPWFAVLFEHISYVHTCCFCFMDMLDTFLCLFLSSEVLKLLALVMNHFSQVEFRGFPIFQGIEIAHDDDRRIWMLLFWWWVTWGVTMAAYGGHCPLMICTMIYTIYLLETAVIRHVE